MDGSTGFSFYTPAPPPPPKKKKNPNLSRCNSDRTLTRKPNKSQTGVEKKKREEGGGGSLSFSKSSFFSVFSLQTVCGGGTIPLWYGITGRVKGDNSKRGLAQARSVWWFIPLRSKIWAYQFGTRVVKRSNSLYSTIGLSRQLPTMNKYGYHHSSFDRWNLI